MSKLSIASMMVLWGALMFQSCGILLQLDIFFILALAAATCAVVLNLVELVRTKYKK